MHNGRTSTVDTPSRTRFYATAATAAFVVAGLTGCAPQEEESTPAPTGPVVEVSGMAYSPATLTIDAGDTVTWEFEDRGIAHDVVGTGGAAAELRSTLMQTGTFTHTFADPGTYDYTCSLHPDMRGTIVVR